MRHHVRVYGRSWSENRDRQEREMTYFVTGATGFIGRNLVERLLEREGTIYVLVREGSKGRLEELRNRWGTDDDRVVGIVGDLSQRRLGVSDADVARLRGRRRPPLPPGGDLRHDRRRGEPAARERGGHAPHGRVRRGGRGRARPHGQLDRRRRALQGDLARGHVRGGREPRHPPLLPDQARVRGRRAQRVLPAVAGLPAGIVVGHSETGEMDKIDGPTTSSS